MIEEKFSIRSLLTTHEGQELLQALVRAWQQGGNQGEPPERWLVKMFRLLYRDTEAVTPPDNADPRVAVHFALENVLEEYQALSLTLYHYIDYREEPLFRRLLLRCQEHLMLVEFAIDTLEQLREAS